MYMRLLPFCVRISAFIYVNVGKGLIFMCILMFVCIHTSKDWIFMCILMFVCVC